jgi:hypothetical protein
MHAAQTTTSTDRRQNERNAYVRYVFFATNKGFHQGELRDYSRHGLYIKSKARVAVGNVITVALPFANNKNEKRKGEIVWRSKEGFGVELFRDPARRVTREDLLI